MIHTNVYTHQDKFKHNLNNKYISRNDITNTIDLFRILNKKRIATTRMLHFPLKENSNMIDFIEGRFF